MCFLSSFASQQVHSKHSLNFDHPSSDKKTNLTFMVDFEEN